MSDGEKESAARRVLLVDDDALTLKGVGRLLARAGYSLSTASSAAEALREFEGSPFDLILTDLHMPEMDGIALLRAIRARDLDVPVVIMTGSPNVQAAVDAMEYGALQFLLKPVEPDQLRATVARATGLARLARVKREALALTEDPGVRALGDLAALEATFARTMTTLWAAFQPIVRVDGTPYGHEALLRSREPLLPDPGAVLDAAEKLGMVGMVGRRMRALATLPVAADPASGVLFVNLHPLDLFDAELTDEDSPLMAIADRVVLEVTERAAIENMDSLRVRTAQIRECGFKLAIDDLGAGYAGLTAFAALEPEVVKLDMSLIRGIDTSPTKRKVVESFSALCRDLGIQIVAEGVETVAELECVIAAGCDLVQGYLLAKPGRPFPGYEWPLSRRDVASPS